MADQGSPAIQQGMQWNNRVINLLNNIIAIVGRISTGYDAGTLTTGTFTPDPGNGQLQHVINNGAHTLAAPTAVGDYTLTILYTNAGSAGAVTRTGFTKQIGDSLDTTDTHKFMLFVTKINGAVLLNVAALQ